MELLAATTSQELGVSVPLLVAAAGVAVLWLVELAVVATMRRVPLIRSEPPTMELPEESPSVAGMLAADFVVPGETAPAILLDLAARRVVELDEVQPGRTICRIRSRADEPLSPAESRVLDAIREKAVDGIVPTEALTTGPEDKSKGWHRALARDVVNESQSAGLTTDRWPKAFVAFLGTSLAIAGALLVIALMSEEPVPDDEEVLAAVAGAIAVGVIALGAFLVTRLGRSLAQLPTNAGKAAAARVGGLERHLQENLALADLPPAAVKLRGRHLAYAAIFGAAPLAVALLPMGAEDDHRAWSSFGGRWRRVRVRYPRAWPPGWGRDPVFSAVASLVVGGIAFAALRGLWSAIGSDRPVEFTPEAWDWAELAFVVTMIPFAIAFAWSASVLVRAVPDISARRTVTGQLVRARRFEKRWTSGDNPTRLHYVAVDDGTRDEIRAFRLSSSFWAQVSQGQIVEVVVTPRLGYVRSISPVATEPKTSEPS